MRAILSNTKVSLLTASAVSVLSLIVILGTANQSLNVRNTANVGGSSCTTASELAVLNDSKANFETQIAEVNLQIASTTAELTPVQASISKKDTEIATIQARITSGETSIVTYKKKADDASSAYTKLTKTRGVSSLKLVTSKNAYVQALNTYNSMVKINETNKSKIASLNADKLDLEAQITAIDTRITDLNSTLTDLNNHLNSINIAIESGTNNPCQINESYCTDGFDNDKDGLIDCADDADCSSNTACMPTVTGTVTATTETSCSDAVDNDNDGSLDCSDSDCSQDGYCVGMGGTNLGTITTGNMGGCSMDSDCGTNQTCSAGTCIDNNTATINTGTNIDNCSDASNPFCNVQPEVCNNGVDDDKNGYADCSDKSACSNAVNCNETACSDNMDNDSDGETDCLDTDCFTNASCNQPSTCSDTTACNYNQVGTCTYDCCKDDNNDGLDDKSGEECRSCVVVVVEGINGTGSFRSTVKKIASDARASVKDWPSLASTNDPDAQEISIKNILKPYYDKAKQTEKILVVAHSLGGVAAYNMKNDYPLSYKDTSFMYYDPPYNYPNSGAIWSVFSKVLTAIKKARNAGIMSVVTDDWTGGYNEPGKSASESTNAFGVAEDTAHNMFESRPALLWQVKSWLNSCPQY